MKISESTDFAAVRSRSDLLGGVPPTEKNSHGKVIAHVCQKFLSYFRRFLHKYILMVNAVKMHLVDFGPMF